MKNIDPNILSVAFRNKDLCTRSGTCIGVCPTNALSLGEDLYPKIDSDLCIECGLCQKTCPGDEVNYGSLAEITFGKKENEVTFDGHVERTYVGYSGNARTRKNGAGGGVVTALAWHLLNSGTVQGCIVTRMNPERPWQGEVFIARTFEDLLTSQQSKYTIIPVNTIFQEIKDLDGTYALIALPCQIHGFRKLQKQKPKLASKIHSVIGLFCASSLEPYIAKEMLDIKGVDKSKVKNFDFRGGAWPGRIRARLKDGGIKNLHYSNFKDGAINYLTYLYSPPRCQTCVDGSSEFSDISVSDAWTRDKSGKYVFASQSRLLARTEIGVKTMEAAIAAGDLVAEDVTEDTHYQTHKLHARKKGLTAYIRVDRMKKLGQPVPIYDRTVDGANSADKRTEWLESLLMRIGRIRAIRVPLFKILISRYGIPLVKIRQYRKSKKYR